MIFVFLARIHHNKIVFGAADCARIARCDRRFVANSFCIMCALAPTANSLQAQQAAARLALSSNIFLVVIKVGAGLQSNSLSVLGEGVQSLLDIVVSALILWTVRAAAAPPDLDHPWGHGKFENLTSLFQMLLVLASIGGIWWASWLRFQSPVMPHVDWGIAAIVVSMAINIWVSRHMSHVARATDSSALAAEAVHLRGDLWACSGVLIGLVATHVFNDARLDPIFAAIMTLFAGYAALHLLRDTLRPLLDETLPDSEEQLLREVLNRDDRVLDFHKLRTRQAGARRLADVHIMLDDDLTFREAHAVSEDVEDAIRAALPNTDVIVHFEPYEEESRHQREAHGS